MAKKSGCRLSKLAADLPARFTASARLQAFPAEASRQLLLQLAESRDSIVKLWGTRLCQSGMLVDQTDGLRITLKNGEIVHLRPSGNAPELRCYAEAASTERAEELVRFSLDRVENSPLASPASTVVGR